MPKSASPEPQSAEATEVESLAMGNREDFDREPVYPTYAMRTMVDPLADDPYNCQVRGMRQKADCKDSLAAASPPAMRHCIHQSLIARDANAKTFGNLIQSTRSWDQKFLW